MSEEERPSTTNEDRPSQDLLRFLLRYWWLIALATAISVGATAFLTWRTEPVYRATATLEISPPRTGISVEELLGANPLQREYLQTMARRVTMRDVLEPVFEEFSAPGQTFEQFRGAIGATPEDGTNLVQVSLDGTSRERIVAIVGKTIDQFLASIALDGAELSASARRVLDSQADVLRKKIDASRAQLDAFMEKHGLRSSLLNEWDLMHEQLQERMQQCEATRNQLALAEAVYDEIRRMETAGEDLSTLPFVLTDPGYVSLETKLQAVDLELADSSQVLGENHPTLRALEKQRETIRTQLDRRLQQLVEQARRDYQIRKNTLEQLTEDKDVLEVRLRETDRRKFEYDRIQREVDRYRSYYERYLKATGDIDPATGIAREQVRVRESAAASTNPVRPIWRLNLALALLAGLLAGIFLGLLVESLRR